MTYESKSEAKTSSNPVLDNLEMDKLRLEIAALEATAARHKSADHSTGSFQFIGVIQERSVHPMIRDIDAFCRRNPGAPVEILLNSEGGSVLDGLALIDFLSRISAKGHRVTIVGCGLCASMASVLLQVADERVLTKHAWLGIHEISSAVQGTVTQQEDTMKFTKNLQQQIISLLIARANVTPAQLRTMWLRKDAYLSADEALKKGFIDRIEGD